MLAPRAFPSQERSRAWHEARPSSPTEASASPWAGSPGIDDGFRMRSTQDAFADALKLTSAHVGMVLRGLRDRQPIPPRGGG